MDLLGFLRVADQLSAEAAVPLVCAGSAVMVELEVDETADCTEAAELERCTVFRGPGVNSRPTSSELMLPAVPLGDPLKVFHPVRGEGGGCNCTGDATAVIYEWEGTSCSQERARECFPLKLLTSLNLDCGIFFIESAVNPFSNHVAIRLSPACS